MLAVISGFPSPRGDAREKKGETPPLPLGTVRVDGMEETTSFSSFDRFLVWYVRFGDFGGEKVVLLQTRPFFPR
jgi:hypothetical protein